MKTFADLEFKNHPIVDDLSNLEGYEATGVMARCYFPNGYGVSVISYKWRSPGGNWNGSYGGVEGLYEVAIIQKDVGIVYNTAITDDVMGYLSEEDVTSVMIKVQRLHLPQDLLQAFYLA